jgi:hypothetical protein
MQTIKTVTDPKHAFSPDELRAPGLMVRGGSAPRRACQERIPRPFGYHGPIRRPKSLPDTALSGRRAECRDTYPALVYLADKVRVIECRLQWCVQHRRSICPNSWRGVSFCRTREALLRCAGSGDPAAMARLRALPKRFPEGLA